MQLLSGKNNTHFWKGLRLIYVVGLLLSAYGLFTLQKARLTGLYRSDTSESSSKESALKTNLEILYETPSFGYENIISDFTFLNFLQYFGNVEERQVAGYSISPLFFENIVRRDPLFIHAYIFLSNGISIYAGRPDLSVALMEQGLTAMSPDMPSDSFYIWRYKAIDELLFLNRIEEARRSHLMAAEWAFQSSEPEAAQVAQSSLETADFLTRDVDSRPAQIRSWFQVFTNAVNDQVRQLAEDRIEALGGTITTDENGEPTIRYRAESKSD